MKAIMWHFLYLVLFHSVFADDESEGFFEVHMECPANNFVLRGLGSRSPFFGDAIASVCTNTKEDICTEQETSYTYTSPDGGFTLDAQCSDENDVIKSLTLSISDAHVRSITVGCCRLDDPGIKEDSFEQTSEASRNSLADCGEGAAMQKISLSDAGNGVVTNVKLGCVHLAQDEGPRPF